MMAFMTLPDFAPSASFIIRGKTDGTTCQDRPNLSFSQPHGPSLPPSDSLAPEMIDLVLGVAHHLERHRFVELELRSAVERGEGLSFELELDDHDRARRLAVDLAAGLGVAADLFDLRIGKDRGVELRRVLGFSRRTTDTA